MLNLIKDLSIHAGLTASILTIVNLESVSGLLSVVLLMVSISIGVQQIYMNSRSIKENIKQRKLTKKKKYYEENKVKLKESKVL
jgi:hypothetical protein